MTPERLRGSWVPWLDEGRELAEGSGKGAVGEVSPWSLPKSCWVNVPKVSFAYRDLTGHLGGQTQHRKATNYNGESWWSGGEFCNLLLNPIWCLVHTTGAQENEDASGVPGLVALRTGWVWISADGQRLGERIQKTNQAHF